MKTTGKKLNKRWIIFGSIILALVIFRLFLPTIVLHYVNKKLQEIPGYTGHVNDIDISLYRGAYQIIELDLKKTGGKVPVPFFSTNVMDISLEWAAIFKGKIVGEVKFLHPVLNFVEGPTKEQSQTKIDRTWKEVVDELVPWRINKLVFTDGQIHYLNTKKSPNFDLYLTNFNGIAQNLSNVNDSAKALPASAEATANAYGNGKFKMTMNLDPFNSNPTFDLNAEITAVQLPKLNDFLKASANVDAEKGTFSIFTEIAAKNGTFKGYVKPVIKDLDLIDWQKEKEDSFLHKIYESIIGGVGKALENKPSNRIASKVPISGKFDNPDIDLWATIGSLLRNAFIEAIRPTIDNTVNFSGVSKEGDKKESRQERKERKKKEKEAEEKKEEAEKKNP
jgi:hypothetical protein